MAKTRIGIYQTLLASVILFGPTIALGVTAGIERDSNVYGGPAEVLFPVSGIAAFIVAAVGFALAIKSYSNTQQGPKQRSGTRHAARMNLSVTRDLEFDELRKEHSTSTHIPKRLVPRLIEQIAHPP